ncbi:MAG: hypothetical protein A2084_00110 [Tenericutes bacterium GWC2_39_45]|nr:MAG: hypothetical protein A2Y43_00705 [Tenericutes bacterium GWA2_38_26]OHE30457.1 MAG: hypothetical protein A2084_00110 [Tenericutes bacterium GWC2_39_45]OHE31916.1 MAG: hypothetical protein A2009_00945 [Tenericutes bacterium GWD2_38_27]OHE36501.1 MAG: hypothetical protein A2013_06645 [Tenericutes bacterium GWE2_38_8]OHE41687.1 MAG: hypothetical protein A2102_04115 [Tenericutes bacterium GWF2_38_8]HBG33165.1 hypothetical protein [Acholeplasmataceae bacterium]
MTWIQPEQFMFANSALLFTYGGMTGYILFIVFIASLQFQSFSNLKLLKPRIGLILHMLHFLMTIFFVIYPFISFNLQFLIIMALIFMLATSMFEILTDKIIQGLQCNTLHPKKIM